MYRENNVVNSISKLIKLIHNRNTILMAHQRYECKKQKKGSYSNNTQI